MASVVGSRVLVDAARIAVDMDVALQALLLQLCCTDADIFSESDELLLYVRPGQHREGITKFSFYSLLKR